VHPFVGIVAAYLLGSIPAAYIAGRLRGVDLRKHGSGNLGATNAWRQFGWKVGLPVYLFDMAKGALPVALFPGMVDTSDPQLWALAYGVAAIVGHYKPIFLGGQGGGKGVATAAGVFAALAPIATMLSILTFGILLAATGYVSMGSLTASVVLVLALLITAGIRAPAFSMSVLVAAFVFWTHRANIARLARGDENRFATPGQLGGMAMLGTAVGVTLLAIAVSVAVHG
jgi:glycerol-3-phosphate acyltransferase PlsY